MESVSKTGRLTLRKLISWSFQPEMVMRQLTAIIHAIGPFKGSHIISIVNSFRPNGIKTVQDLLDRLLNFLIQPLQNYIFNWVYRGELNDKDEEFFIRENKRVSDSEEWT